MQTVSVHGLVTAGFLLLALAALLTLLAAHPFTTYPLSLRLLARWRPRPLRALADVPRRAALCVCAYNEAGVIRAKALNMLAMQDAVPGLDLLVYVDAASDGTAAVLAEVQDAFPGRLRVVVAEARHGKTHGMNTLVGMTDAEVVVFSDANVEFDAQAVPRLLAPFADPEVGAVCGHLVYAAANATANATAETGSIYWRLEERIKALETATGSAMGADGSIFAIRRALHRPPPPDLIDDMYVSLSVLCAGGRIVRVADALAYEEPVSRPGEEFARKIRIACQAFNVHRALHARLRTLPALDQYKYLSHKLLRWLVGYLLVAALLCGAVGLGLVLVPLGATPAFVALLAVGAGIAVAVGSARGGKLATLRDALGAFAATGIGVARSLRGDRFQTWNPPASARGSFHEKARA